MSDAVRASEAAGLGEFQDALARAIVSGEARSTDPCIAALAAQPGFAVYRNTVMKGWIDALQANYPAVTRLVGEEWLRASARVYARTHPPCDARLLMYGEGFADFLATFEPARELPYLADVARLDRFWSEAHVAADAVPLAGTELTALTQDRLARTVLMPHPAARWRWFGEAPIASLWSRNRADACDGDVFDVEWRGEGMLLTRPHEHVRHARIDRAACAFLDGCAAGRTLDACVTAALEIEAETDFARLMPLLLEAGAFRALAAPSR